MAVNWGMLFNSILSKKQMEIQQNEARKQRFQDTMAAVGQLAGMAASVIPGVGPIAGAAMTAGGGILGRVSAGGGITANQGLSAATTMMGGVAEQLKRATVDSLKETAAGLPPDAKITGDLGNGIKVTMPGTGGGEGTEDGSVPGGLMDPTKTTPREGIAVPNDALYPGPGKAVSKDWNSEQFGKFYDTMTAENQRQMKANWDMAKPGTVMNMGGQAYIKNADGTWSKYAPPVTGERTTAPRMPGPTTPAALSNTGMPTLR